MKIRKENNKELSLLLIILIRDFLPSWLNLRLLQYLLLYILVVLPRSLSPIISLFLQPLFISSVLPSIPIQIYYSFILLFNRVGLAF